MADSDSDMFASEDENEEIIESSLVENPALLSKSLLNGFGKPENTSIANEMSKKSEQVKLFSDEIILKESEKNKLSADEILSKKSEKLQKAILSKRTETSAHVSISDFKMPAFVNCYESNNDGNFHKPSPNADVYVYYDIKELSKFTLNKHPEHNRIRAVGRFYSQKNKNYLYSFDETTFKIELDLCCVESPKVFETIEIFGYFSFANQTNPDLLPTFIVVFYKVRRGDIAAYLNLLREQRDFVPNWYFRESEKEMDVLIEPITEEEVFLDETGTNFLEENAGNISEAWCIANSSKIDCDDTFVVNMCK